LSIKLAKQVLKGDIQAASKLITAIENDLPGAIDGLDEIYPHTGRSYVIGITGPPGTGKSTLINALIGNYRSQDKTVGVIVVDPTSPLTQGALLGDRIRMQKHSLDKGVYIRSMATRGCLGGLAWATSNTIHILDAVGKDIVLVETVGTGQSEVDISQIADTTLVLLNAGGGDTIQMMKAGLMEVADIFVINKADLGGSDSVESEIKFILEMKKYSVNGWKPSIVITDAISGKGVDQLVEEIQIHHDFLIHNGGLAKNRQKRAKQELIMELQSSIRDFINNEIQEGGLLHEIIENYSMKKETSKSAVLKIVDLFAKQSK